MPLARDSLTTYIIFILPLFILALIATFNHFSDSDSSTSTAATAAVVESTVEMATKPSNHNLNVLKKPLALFSQKPMTGFYRDGYCRVGPEDGGNHAVAAVVSKEFLDFSAARGNNLRQIPGLDAGCKWCLCTARWKEAMEAAKGKDDPVVPKVFLHATDESALQNGITLDTLKKYAAAPEASGGGGALEKNAPISPSAGGGLARETH